jgi:hypothetical protein
VSSKMDSVKNLTEPASSTKLAKTNYYKLSCIMCKKYSRSVQDNLCQLHYDLMIEDKDSTRRRAKRILKRARSIDRREKLGELISKLL